MNIMPHQGDGSADGHFLPHSRDAFTLKGDAHDS